MKAWDRLKHNFVLDGGAAHPNIETLAGHLGLVKMPVAHPGVAWYPAPFLALASC